MSDAVTSQLRSYEFVLPFALESLNVRDRKHFGQRHRAQDLMQLEIIAAIGGTRYLPRPPFARARITVVRCSAGTLDEENCSASLKGLVDCLCVRSATHPHGVGVFVDDAPRYLERVVTQSTAPRGAGSTMVRIEELPALPVVAAAPAKPKRKRKGGMAWRGKQEPMRRAALMSEEELDAMLNGGL